MSDLWHLYLIECANGAYYAGITNDVAARYEKHCTGRGARYTRANPPVRLVGSRPCGDKSAALKAEHAIRKLSRAGKVQFITEDEGVPEPQPRAVAPTF